MDATRSLRRIRATPVVVPTPAQPVSRLQRALQTAVRYGLLVLLVLAILAFGAVENWAILAFQAGTALLLILWVVLQAAQGYVEIVPNPLYRPVAAFGALIIAQATLGLSAYANATRVELWQYLGYGTLFFLASQMFASAASRSRWLAALGVFGFLLALFAIIQHFTSPGLTIYWIRKTVAVSVFGPYANHNHYAGVMELLLPIPLLMALDTSRAQAYRVMLAFMTAVMLTSLFLSGSRGGMVAVAGQVAALGLLLLRRRSRRGALALAVVVLVSVLLIGWFGRGDVLGRIETLQKPRSDTGFGDRLTIDKDSLRMFLGRPIAGWGLDTFQYVYPQYRSFASDTVVDYAHNDYVQALAETGALGFACIVAFIAILGRTAWQLTQGQGRRPRTLGLRVAALLGCTGLLIHSVADFNLHITANAALFYVLAAIACTGAKLTVPSRPRLRGE